MSDRQPQRKGGLGRGLAALIPTGPLPTSPLPTRADDPAGTGATQPPDAAGTWPVGAGPDERAEARDGSGASAHGSRGSGTAVDARPAADDRSGDRAGSGVPQDGRAASGSGADAGAADGSGAPVGAIAGGVRDGSERDGGPVADFREIPMDSVVANPHQPRTQFDDEALAELQHSIREFGLLQPVVVREVGPGSYQLVMGERRWRAARAAGLSALPAIVRHTADDAMLRDALLENIHRVQLNPLDEAAAYEQLLAEFGVTHTELADRIGRSRPVVTNTIRLLKLPVPVQRRVAAGVLSAGHARALLGLDDAGQQEELAARIVAEGLSVRATEEAVVLARRETPTVPRQARRRPLHAPGLQDLAEKLSDRFDTRVKVEMGQRKGRIVVEFGSVDDLERIAQLMRSADDAG